MSQEQSVKIRTLPRSTETKPKETPQAKKPRWIIYVGTASCLMLLSVIASTHLTPKKPTARRATATAASTAPRAYDAVNRHLQEAAMKREMLMQTRQIENMKLEGKPLDADLWAGQDSARSYGVQLDQENTIERVYEDLNEDRYEAPGEMLPADRINARLANRRWVNEYERAERVAFVRNFIRSAAERGYEVQLDQNLVVVGVRKISGTQKVNIDQVLNRLAQQGF